MTACWFRRYEEQKQAAEVLGKAAKQAEARLAEARKHLDDYRAICVKQHAATVKAKEIMRILGEVQRLAKKFGAIERLKRWESVGKAFFRAYHALDDSETDDQEEQAVMLAAELIDQEREEMHQQEGVTSEPLSRLWDGNLKHSRELSDDWGCIRDESGRMVLKVNCSHIPEMELGRHRQDGTDPTQPVVDYLLMLLNAPEGDAEKGDAP